jgi:hypothetical protein
MIIRKFTLFAAVVLPLLLMATAQAVVPISPAIVNPSILMPPLVEVPIRRIWPDPRPHLTALLHGKAAGGNDVLTSDELDVVKAALDDAGCTPLISNVSAKR